eukprot:130561_1
MADTSSQLSMDSVDLEDENEDTQLLTQSKPANYINFNLPRIRLIILTTLYYIWIIPTLSIDINTLNGGTSGGGGGGGGGNSSLSKDDKIIYRILIAGNIFLLLASIINSIDLMFYLYENTNIGKYCRYACGGLF